MKPWHLIPALAIFLAAQTGCKDLEKERQKHIADSTASAQRMADSLEEIEPIAGAPFGCSRQQAMQAIDEFDRLHRHLIVDFEYDQILPHFHKEELMGIKIMGRKYSWDEFDVVQPSVNAFIRSMGRKYGTPIYENTKMKTYESYDEERMVGWKRGDKEIGLRVISDNKYFMYEIDINSEKRIKEYVHYLASPTPL